MRFKYFLLIVLMLNCLNGISQSAWSDWEEIYKDVNVTVKLQYKLSANSCVQGGKQNKYRYDIDGKLRTTAYFVNWKMDYIACNGNLYYQQNSINIGSGGSLGKVESMDYMFICDSVVQNFYEAAGSNISKTETELLAYPTSKEATSIKGAKSIYLGDSTKLSVFGGILGVGAKWKWYKGQCGGSSIGKGTDLFVTPTETSTYYVRAEGANNTTNCVSTTITVNQESRAATSIKGGVKLCRGSSSALTVVGGALGLDAEWYWYEDICDGKLLGKGKSITVTPDKNTSYYVKAIGKANTTACTSIDIVVYEKSINPSTITGEATICEGNTVQLNIQGGSLADGAVWKWYEGSCCVNPIATSTDNSISIAPTSSTKYYVRGEGYCNTTDNASFTINVNQNSVAPTYIISKNVGKSNRKVNYTISGGTLGENAKWMWYKNGCGTGKYLDEGSSITLRIRKPTTIYVRAEGLCNKSSCTSEYINPSRLHFFDPIYSEHPKKFSHFGAGLGVDVLSFSDSDNADSLNLEINGLGFRGEVSLHPIIKNYLSLGFISNFSLGASAFLFNKGLNNSGGTPKTEKYLYSRFEVGTELAFGLNKVKFLLKNRRSIQRNNFEASITQNGTTNNFYFDKKMCREIILAGFRLSSYNRKPMRRGHSIDITYNLSKDYPNGLFDFTASDYNLLGWKMGFGFEWWIQSVLKIQVDLTMNSTQSNFNFKKEDFNKSYLNLSLIINRDWFY